MTVTKDKLKAQSFIRLAVAQLRTTASLRMEPEGGVFFRWWREAFYCQNSLAEQLSPTASLNAPPPLPPPPLPLPKFLSSWGLGTEDCPSDGPSPREGAGT